MRSSSVLAAAKVLAGLPVRSQHDACRNALIASTAMAARRRERAEVDDFLAEHLARTQTRGASPIRRVAAL
jgi:hypothetical protein